MANDDLVGVVRMLFIADVIEPTDVTAIACHDPIASGGREQATELRLPPQAPLCILTADPLTHGERSVVRFAGQQRCPPTTTGHSGGVSRFRQIATCRTRDGQGLGAGDRGRARRAGGIAGECA